MALYTFEGREPKIDRSAFVFPDATVIGDVTIGREVWVGPGAVLRGDYGKIEVGDYSAIEDNVVVHARPGETTVIGNHVTVGHLSVIHTPTISDWVVIGMGAVISDFAHIGTWAAIGEGAVVKNNFEVPEKAIAVGIPAKVIGNVSQEYMDLWTKYKANYNSFSSRYKTNLHTIEQ